MASRERLARVPLASLTVEEFRDRYMIPNEPVLLTGATHGWRAVAEWVTPRGAPDISRLAALFGASSASVVEEGGARRTMRLSEYADWWRARSAATPPLYLKDWHLPALFPSYGAYTPPPHLAEDWLNEHWRQAAATEAGDHRFVYVGPAGSRTPLHADVLFSYSWSANVCGSKRWILVPASQRGLVSDRATAPLATDVHLLEQAAAGLRLVEVEQQAGELLFVPSGWYHQVENTTDVISINHNWLNAYNAHWSIVRLAETLVEIKSRLAADDASDGALCELLLEQRCGLGLCGLCELLLGVLRRRLPVAVRRSGRLEKKRMRETEESMPHRTSLECDRAAETLRETIATIEREYESPWESTMQQIVDEARLLLCSYPGSHQGQNVS
ncbi:hypothetical protein AB1Y20_023351 [Prymnesium parvum]|uniref:JmjC domain-containing protein n=1 Tax=Prymnesium parvum TaxID=97485 RepID=A0AB34JFY3_PRYPA